jgi:hypothetical protein
MIVLSKDKNAGRVLKFDPDLKSLVLIDYKSREKRELEVEKLFHLLDENGNKSFLKSEEVEEVRRIVERENGNGKFFVKAKRLYEKMKSNGKVPVVKAKGTQFREFTLRGLKALVDKHVSDAKQKDYVLYCSLLYLYRNYFRWGDAPGVTTLQRVVKQFAETSGNSLANVSVVNKSVVNESVVNESDDKNENGKKRESVFSVIKKSISLGL